MARLLLVRHAEPLVTGVMLGRSDPPLSEAGRMQARRELAALRVPVVYTSPLKRALETARAVEAAQHVVLDDLMEIGLGEWDGLSWDEIERTHPALARAKLTHWLGVTPPGGEDWLMFEKRIERALATISAGPFPAAVVGHVAVNAEIVRQIAGTDPIDFNQGYCEVLEYPFEPRIKQKPDAGARGLN